MLRVYHHILCPHSRQLRILLSELGIKYELLEIKFWQRDNNFLMINPTARLPVIINVNNKAYYGEHSLLEFIFESFDVDPSLLGTNNEKRYQIRNLYEWFGNKMYNEVTKYLVQEKFVNIINSNNSTNSSAIIAAKRNLKYHLDYIEHLLKNHDTQYLQGDSLSVADIAAAAQLSTVDYLGDLAIKNDAVKQWYSLLKSRPSVRAILQDTVPTVQPPSGYSNPDQ